MSNKLKPCPFCGGEAEIERQYHGGYVVYCQNENCGCAIFGNRDEVLKAWNTRADEPETYDDIQAEINRLTEKLMAIKRKELAKEERRLKRMR